MLGLERVVVYDMSCMCVCMERKKKHQAEHRTVTARGTRLSMQCGERELGHEHA